MFKFLLKLLGIKPQDITPKERTKNPAELSDDELRQAITERENSGQTGKDCPVLHELNCEQTNRLSNDQIRTLIKKRTEEGKPIGKLVAAARDRGILIPSNMSGTELSQAIKEREVQGHTGRTDPTTHALNCAQTDRLSTGQINSLIESRRAAGLPTGKLEAARRDRS